MHLASPGPTVQIFVLAGTFLGCLPNNFVAVSAGSKLGELQSLRDLYDRKLLLLGLSLLVCTCLQPNAASLTSSVA